MDTNVKIKPKNTSLFKAAFQNVRTLSNNKLTTIIQQLQKGDIFFLNEVNQREFVFPNSEAYFFHHDPIAFRICVIASKMLDIKPIGRGLLLTQERTQVDKNAVQSFVYRIQIKHVVFYVESFYVIPSLSRVNLDILIEHLETQAQKFPNYFCGGDFNLNVNDKSIASNFDQCTNLTQRISKFTRVQDYRVTGPNGNSHTRTSQSIIDLIFTNPGIDNFYKSSTPITVAPNKSDAFPSRHAPFDHKCVTITFTVPIKRYYNKVQYFKNPNDRPIPTPDQVTEINEKINNLDVTKIQDYDHLVIKTRAIVDVIVPTHPNGPTEKMFYRIPYSKELVSDIRLKYKLEKLAVRSNEDRQRYRMIRNSVKNRCKKEANTYYKNLFKKAHTPDDITQTLNYIQNNRLSNISGNPEKIEIAGISGKDLADKMSNFMKNRAEKLVTDSEVDEAGLPPPPLREDESLPNTLDIKLPIFDDLKKIIPSNKLSNAAGPDRLSAKLISLIWPAFKTKLNDICQRGEPKFPAFSQGYIQRTISKTSQAAEVMKDLRPIGVNNSIPKYAFNKPVFKQIRNHLTPIFKKRNNYSYQGTHLCIIKTLDKILELVEKKKPTILVKYDFSNAFGTIHHNTMHHTLQGLNLSRNCIQYILDYMYFQRPCQTVISDKTGFHYSDPVVMERGCPQGQIGADLIFLMQQLVLRELDGIFRTLYVDDINDVASSNNSSSTIQLALLNESQLISQVKSVGFMLNDGKTKYAPFNVSKQDLLDAGISDLKIETDTCILGFPFECKNNGLDVLPSANMIINRLNEKARTTHAIRGYIPNNPTLRVKLARALIYHSIGEIHLVLAYAKYNYVFDRIHVKVNNVLRATGLKNTTSGTVLDKVLGTNLLTFAKHGIILNGLKMHWGEPGFFDRWNKIRKRFAYNSYSNTFVHTWNELPADQRKHILDLPHVGSVKNYLKSVRKLDYDPQIHIDNKWVDYSEV